MRDHRDVAHLILRLTIGSLFLLDGVGKIRGGVTALPAAEIAVGALLVFGLFTSLALTASGLMIGALIVTSGKPDALPLALGVFALYYTVDRNGWSLDALRKGRRKSSDAQPHTLLRVHTSDNELVFGVMPTDRGASDDRETRLFISRAEEPIASAEDTPARGKRAQRERESVHA